MKEHLILTKQILEDKLEGLNMARDATRDPNDSFKLTQIINQYETKYEEVTGVRYEYEKDTR